MSMRTAFAVGVLLCAVGFTQAAESERRVERWLLLSPRAAPLPAFHAQKDGEFSLSDLLTFPSLPLQELRPRAGESVARSDGTVSWQEERSAEVTLAGGEGIQEAYLAATLQVSRFTSLELVVSSHHLLRVTVDGVEVATKTAATAAADEEDESGRKRRKKDDKKKEPAEPGEAKAELDLEPGLHRIVVRALRDPESPHPWTVAALLRSSGDELPPVQLGTSPEHPLELEQILEVPQPAGVTVSPDGELVAIRLGRIRPGTDDRESWVEVRHTADGELERTYRGASLSGLDWAPQGKRLSYITRDSEVATLWLADLEAGDVRPILDAVEHLGSYVWAPDGRSVIYSIAVEPPENEHGIQRLWGLRDRQAGMRERSYLHQVFLDGGLRRRLTAGELTTDLADVSPDGRRLLFTRTMDDYDKRPFVRSELSLLDLQTLQVESIYPGPWLNAATWSPDGRRLLVRGGPSAFDGAGIALPHGMVPNEYDNQLYLLELDGGKVTPLTREFDPGVSSAVWHRGDGQIYLSATDGSNQRLYRLDPDEGTFTTLQTGVDAVGEWDVSTDAAVAVFIGSGAAQPPRVSALDLALGRVREILVPAADAFREVRLGEVKDWSFRSRLGATIQGRVHYPPDFDPERRYPAIIYYYGGTFPTIRTFGGRYPKNWWAAHGYVVYVLQPSGAVGYGQEFSALHVNDWGGITGEDILEGVDQFLSAHPFVDPERLGCIGASYGGFMTQYLLTRTERFAAGISHAGISSLGSYWGEGYWGYAYSGVATADSYPWNRGDLYVGHSPLFNAHKIRTPLLLLHGADDTNVPPGESEQLYTALKLLQRPVEYVRIEGQDHHILKHDQRVIWSQTIVAFFDRWLKDQPEWWDHLYPGPGGGGE